MPQTPSFFDKLSSSLDRDDRSLAVSGGFEEGSEGQLMLDVYQTADEIVIKAPIAGTKPEDLDISITNDTVTIRGKRHHDEVINSDDYFYRECHWGAFSRQVILPIEIDADAAVASLKNGILSIRLPKPKGAKGKKIRVKTENAA